MTFKTFPSLRCVNGCHWRLRACSAGGFYRLCGFFRRVFWLVVIVQRWPTTTGFSSFTESLVQCFEGQVPEIQEFIFYTYLPQCDCDSNQYWAMTWGLSFLLNVESSGLLVGTDHQPLNSSSIQSSSWKLNDCYALMLKFNS